MAFGKGGGDGPMMGRIMQGFPQQGVGQADPRMSGVSGMIQQLRGKSAPVQMQKPNIPASGGGIPARALPPQVPQRIPNPQSQPQPQAQRQITQTQGLRGAPSAPNPSGNRTPMRTRGPLQAGRGVY